MSMASSDAAQKRRQRWLSVLSKAPADRVEALWEALGPTPAYSVLRQPEIGLVMLIGLAAKNAILIVEFAKMKRDEGIPILDAAVEGSRLRLRPILMTSFAFILGCVPLMLATGSGAASRSTMGTGVVFGMTIATAVGLFLIPVCYVFVQQIIERRGKKSTLTAAAVENPALG